MRNPWNYLYSGLLLLAATTPALTVPPERVRFVAVGDFGTGAQIQYQVAKAMAAKCKQSGCDFAVTLGDNIYNNGVDSVSDSQFQTKFEQPFAPLNFRFYMVLGNHDYRGNVAAQVAYSKKSRKWYMPATYYHFTAGPVAFFALDTNQPDAKQQQFMQSALKQSKSPWKIAFGHHPRTTNSFYRMTQSPDLRKLVDGFCGQAALYLSGHEHDKQHLKAVCGTEYVILGTGAGQRPFGRGTNTRYASNTFGFGWFDVTPTQLHFEILDVSGKVEHSYTLKR